MKESHQHSQSIFLGVRNRLTPTCSSCLHIWVILERKVLLLERDGIIEQELRNVFEHLGYSALGEIPIERAREVGENDGDVGVWGAGEDCGQSGECMSSPDSDAWDGPIDDDDGRNGVNVVLDLSRNTLLVKGILLRIAGVGKTRRINDANLGRGYYCSRNTLTLTTIPFLLLSSYIRAELV